MRRIIVATDGSPGANRAVDAAARMAKLTRCELMILTVSGNVSGAELRRLASAEGDLSESLKSAMNNILSRARKRALGKGVSAVRLQSGWGHPAGAIIDIVRWKKADILVVVGRRGRGRLAGLLLGSVSQKLATLAPRNVTIVP